MAADETLETVMVFSGTQAECEALTSMLSARGLWPQMTQAHEVEGGTAISEAQILVPPDQVEDAKALIDDFVSGAAAKK
jgi:hypothetical protein